MRNKALLDMRKVLLFPLLFLLFTALGMVTQAQTVTTDKADYFPGEVVTISGSGFTGNETVTIVIEHLNFLDHEDDVLYATTAADGSFVTKEYVISVYDLGELFHLIATDESGKTDDTYFTDGKASNGDGIVTVSPLTVCGAGTYNYTFSFRTVNGKDWDSGSQATFTLPSGWSSATIGVVGVNGTASLGTPTGNTYPVNFNCSGGASNGFDFTVTGASMLDFSQYIIPVQTKPNGGTLTDLADGFPFVKSSSTSNGTIVGSINSCSTTANSTLTVKSFSGTITRWEYRTMVTLYPTAWTGWSQLTGGGLGNPAIGTQYNNNNVAVTTQYRVVTSGASCGENHGGEFYSDTAMVALGTSPILVTPNIIDYDNIPLTVDLTKHVQIFSVVPIVSTTFYVNYGTGSQLQITSPYTFPAGTTVVTVVVINTCGTTVQSFSVTSGIPAQITCPASFSVNTSEDGTGDCLGTATYTLVYDGPTATATPAAGHYIGNPLPTITYSLNGTDYSPWTGTVADLPKGPNTIYLIASNAGATTNPCSFTVTVVDNEAPVLIDPSVDCGSLNESDINMCLSEAEAFDPNTLESSVAALYKDNCPGTVVATYVSTSPHTGNNDCEWSFKYIFNIEDIVGNITSCEVYYSGSDQTAPNLINVAETCSSLDIEDVNECLDVAAVWDATQLEDEVAALYEDNCGDPVVATLTGTTPGVDNDDCDWTFTYNYKIEDDCGNFVSCDVVRSGSDQTAPNLIDVAETCSSLDIEDVNECLDVAAVWDATQLEDEVAALYEDNCGDPVVATLTGTTPGVDNDDCDWTFTYNYKIEDDCGNFVSCDVVRSGSDQTAPNLKDEAETCSSLDIEDVNECLDVAAVWDATQLEDEVAALYEDNCGDPVVATLTGTTPGVDNDDCDWTFTYNYKIEDDCGNFVSCDVVRSGSDQTAPNLKDVAETCSSLDIEDVNECLDVAAVWDATQLEDEVAALYEDNCGDPVVATLTGTTPGVDNDDCDWTFTYNYKIEDDCGNFVSCDVVRSGSDQTAPNLIDVAETCSSLDIEDVNECLDVAAVWDATQLEDEVAALYEDNCGDPVVATLTGTTPGVDNDDCDWTFTYNYKIEDDCGNFVSCDVVRSGSDQTAPTVITKDIDVNLNSDGTVTILDNAVDNGSYDNCGEGVTFSLSQKLFTCDNIGPNTVTLTVTDECGNSATGTAVVTVYVPTTTVAKVSAESTRYLDQITLYTEIESNCHTTDFAGTVQFYLDGIPVGDPVNAWPIPYGEEGYPTKLRATYIHTVTQLPKDDYETDDWEVTAEFTPSTPYYNESEGTTSLFIYPREAKPYDANLGFYTGEIVGWITSATSNSATITLAATLMDTSIPTGDVRGAKVTFGFIKTGADGPYFDPIPSASNLPVGLIDQLNSTIGFASADVQINIAKSSTSENFDIAVMISGGYYNDPIINGTAQITIARSLTTGSILGSGNLLNTNSVGLIKGAKDLVPGTDPDTGDEISVPLVTKYSFNVVYNRKATNPQGYLNLTIVSWYDKTGVLDGKPHTYFVKSNAINNFIVGPGSGLIANEAIFEAKANISELVETDVDEVYAWVPVVGNSPMIVKMTDEDITSDTIKYDKIAITYFNAAGGIWYSNNWNINTQKTDMQVIYNGFIDVSGSTTTINKTKSVEITSIAGKAELMVYPNPFSDKLRLDFVSPNDTHARIDMFDLTGRMVQTVFNAR